MYHNIQNFVMGNYFTVSSWNMEFSKLDMEIRNFQFNTELHAFPTFRLIPKPSTSSENSGVTYITPKYFISKHSKPAIAPS